MKTSSFTFVVMADAHIRPEEGSGPGDYPSNQFFNARNRYAIRQINHLAPDLVVHLGDMPHPIPALPIYETAVQVAHELYQRLDARLYVLPGNHDVGDKPNAWTPAPAVTEESHAVFEQYWGRSYLSFDHKDCHFVLLDTPVLNSGLQRERDQREWLERDLAANQKAGKRVFLFTHYPLYLKHPQEAEHYDNIGEPARSWLLALLKKYSVTAVFAGHVHNFFYNQYLNTDLYVLPSVAFVRPEFSEMFHVGPALEYGRNDVEKLGFFLVGVDQAGHSIKLSSALAPPSSAGSGVVGEDADRSREISYGIEFVRTRGLTDEPEDAIVARPPSLSGGPAGGSRAPVGVSLRHAWATSIRMPFDNLDEFTRKCVRNDYLLLALWELGIRKLRVPLGDLADGDTRERMRVLRTLGHEFTVISAGIPNSHTSEMIVRHHALLDSWEVTAPWGQIPAAILGIRDVKQKVAVRTMLSKLDTLGDQQRGQEFHFSHFPDHGFRLAERDLLSSCMTMKGATEAIDGFVFRLASDVSPWEGIRSAARLAAELGRAAAMHVELPRESEGVACVQDRGISNRIAETLAAALAVGEVDVFLDTFVDHDRGYYPRNGLLDRRYNPRPAYYVFRHLQRAVGSRQREIKMTGVEASAGIRAFALETPHYRSVLLLSEAEENRVELSLALDPGSGLRDGVGKWMDLQTGRVREVRWRQLPVNGGWIHLDIPSARFDPVLLVLDWFAISSGELRVAYSEPGDDWSLEGQEKAEGTTVFMQIHPRSDRRAREVFDEYAAEEDDYGFTRTQVPVALAKYGDESLLSRSQARRLLARFDRFREVSLDFKGVETIGQAFADEIFRVFRNQNPHIRLIWINANEQVEKMILRAVSR